MKRKNTLWSLVLALVMVLGVFAPLSALAASTEETKDITVNVHKILMSKAALDKHDINKKYDPTVKIADIGDFFGDKNAQEIDGVYFVALKEGHKNYDNFESLTADEQKAVVDGVADNMKGLTGDAKEEKDKVKGQIALTLQSPGKYKIYEVKSMSTYSGTTPEDKRMLAEQKAVPVKLDLPDHARTEKGVADVIHVYPKNTDDKPEVNKWVVNKDSKDVKEASFDKTEEHTWAIEAKIPTGFKDYKTFELLDTLDKALTYVPNQKIEVQVGTKTTETTTTNKTIEKFVFEKKLAETDFTAEFKGPDQDKELKDTGGRLTVKLTDSGIKNLAKLLDNEGNVTQPGDEGKVIRVEFKTTINDNAVMSKNIPNTVTLKYGHNPDSTGTTKPGENPRVYTGGKKFVKIDSSKNKEKLDGAKFVVKNSEGKYLAEVDGKYNWVDVENENVETLKDTKYNLKVLESGKDGEKGAFEIKGLKYDRPNGTKYKIVEIEAPEGYALPSDNKFEFTVNDTSYYKDPKTIELGTAAGDADPQEVDNRPLTIPQTGGMGTMIFMVAGLALMGGAFIAMRKRSAEQA